MLQGINSYCGALNLEGLKSFQYLPTAWIDRENYRNIVNSANMWQGDVPLLQGNWLTASVFPFSRLWREDPRSLNGRPVFSQSVSGTTPLLRPGVTGELARMLDYLFIIRVQDKNERWWIMGTPDTPFSFSYRASTDGTPGYEISFTGDMIVPAAGYAAL